MKKPDELGRTVIRHLERRRFIGAAADPWILADHEWEIKVSLFVEQTHSDRRRRVRRLPSRNRFPTGIRLRGRRAPVNLRAGPEFPRWPPGVPVPAGWRVA